MNIITKGLHIIAARPIKAIATIIKYIVLLFFAAVAIFPFYWAIISSMKTNDELYANPLSLPAVFSFDNYAAAWELAKIGPYFINTMFVSLSAVALVLLLAAMAAYIMSRVLKKSTPLYIFFSIGLMIPAHTIIVPLFTIFHNIGLTNNFIGLILAFAAMQLALAIFILYAFMRDLPIALEEAAFIDGCSRIETFFRVILPLTLPGMATVGILSFLYFWNEFLIPLVLMTKSEVKMLSQGIQALNGQYVTDVGIMFAGVVIVCIPVIIAFIIFQDQVVKGMVAGAVKG